MCEIIIRRYHGHYHALEAIVVVGESVSFSTDIPEVTFTVGINNSDGYFNVGPNCINVDIRSIDGPRNIGNISTGGLNVNYYKITVKDGGGDIKGTNAPPRIIRVVD